MSHGADATDRRSTGWTRRDALKLAGLAGAAAGLGHRAPARARQATPAGDRPTLRVGVPVLPSDLDPQLDLKASRAAVISTLFDGLLERDQLAGDPPGTGSTPVPMLATAWRRVGDLTLELSLRPDVHFHDGSPLTTEDVAFSFAHVLSSSRPEHAQAADTLGTTTRVAVVDGATVRLTTADPDPLLERRLASWAGMVVPRAGYERLGPARFALAPIGTGPYTVVEFRPEERLTLAANDEYWGGRPPAARIEFRVLPEVAARLAALVSGEVDLIAGVPPDQIATLEAAEGVAVASVPVTNVRTLVYNTKHPLMADKRLRRALNLAIDRQLIIDALWGGRAGLPRGYQFADWGNLYNPERPFPPYDPSRARELIVAAGYDGEPIGLRTAVDYYVLGEEVSQAIVEMWRAVGINAEIELIDSSAVYENPERMTALTSSNANEFADPESFWIRWNAASSIGGLWWPNDRFEELGRRGRTLLDPEERFAVYQEMVDLWEEEAPGTVLYVPTDSFGLRRGLSWQPYAFYYLDFRPDNLAFG